MSRGFVTSGPAFFGSRSILRMFADGSEVPSMDENPRRAAEESATADARDVPPSSRVSFIAADRDQPAERVDGVAGSEFVDDRIRLRE